MLKRLLPLIAPAALLALIFCLLPSTPPEVGRQTRDTPASAATMTLPDGALAIDIGATSAETAISLTPAKAPLDDAQVINLNSYTTVITPSAFSAIADERGLGGAPPNPAPQLGNLNSEDPYDVLARSAWPVCIDLSRYRAVDLAALSSREAGAKCAAPSRMRRVELAMNTAPTSSTAPRSTPLLH